VRDRFARELCELEEAWLACFSTMGELGKEAVETLVGTSEGRSALGRGGGGDTTLELDSRAEAAILGALRVLAPEPIGIVSEEEGIIPGPDGSATVLVDPVDGSLNAKRGLPPFCAAFAMGRGPMLRDIEIGFVADYSRSAWHAAVKGAGYAASAFSSAAALGDGDEVALGADGRVGASRDRTGGTDPRWGREIEVVLLEAGRPHGHTFAYRDLARLAGETAGPEMRVRQIGSLALCLCHISSGTADVLFAPVPSRAVDIAGGLLMVAESGGGAASLDGSDLWAQPADLVKRAPFVAWRRGLDPDDVIEAARSILT
jgi:myo-inositol-1(or 4)-monophosphatase